MSRKDFLRVSKNSFSLLALKPALLTLLFSLLITLFTTRHKQYTSNNVQNIKNNINGGFSSLKGREQFFFNARKNPYTNKMDYKSMLAADLADKAMVNHQKSHATSSLPIFTWNSVGPTNTGGETKAILIDNNDPSHQTIFAGGIAGGIWKSTNGGATWGNTMPSISFSLDDSMSNMNVSCIAQDVNGVIYIGTGDGFTSAIPEYCSGLLGGGIFKSMDDGATWHLLPATIPIANFDNVKWAYTNRIAVNPINPLVIYAATGNVGANGGGLYVTNNGGNSWSLCINSANSKNLTATSQDVKISNDGSVVVAEVGGYGYICYPLSGPDSLFAQIPYTGAGSLPGNSSRIEFAISPTDPNRIYASDIASNGSFGANPVSGIFMTQTAKTNGGYWYMIGPGGSFSFDPYKDLYNLDQAVYDNTLAVSPANEGYLLVGGTALWKWNSLFLGDTIGAWVNLTHTTPLSNPDSNWIHTNDQTIVFDSKNPDIVFVGCDGGVFKSYTDGNSWLPYNRNYDVTEFFNVAFAPQVNYIYNSTLNTVGLGIGGGTQDNGLLYIKGNGPYSNDGYELESGDASSLNISSINPNIAYYATQNGQSFQRTNNFSSFTTPIDAYTKTIGNCQGANIDSVGRLCAYTYLSNFIFPVSMYENNYDTLNHDSIQFITLKNYAKGDTIWANGANGSYPYVFTKSISSNDTISIPDRVVSRVAVGFDAAHGIWINGQGASNNSVIWMPIAGALSSPTPLIGGSISVISWTGDGDAIFSGDVAGNIFRFTNINSIIANDFCSGALWYSQGGAHPTGNTNIVSTKLTLAQAANRYILSIAVDPKNGNNILVTVGGYGGAGYVFYSSNALNGVPTFKDVTGNLPQMPVYSSIMNIRNQDGSWSGNTAMIGTEHGIYTTDKINGSSTIWVKNNNGMANCLVRSIKKQTMDNWWCNNAGDIYAATVGRGLWVSNTNFQAPTSLAQIVGSDYKNTLSVYPNPIKNQGNVEFSLNREALVTIRLSNLEGKEVLSLFRENVSIGRHSFQFNTTDLPPGSYFITLSGKDLNMTKKIIIIR